MNEPSPSHHRPVGVRGRPYSASYNARMGFWLFGIYLLLYAGFMGLNAFDFGLMRARPFGGVNVAAIYGMGLIVAAFLLAILYMALCRPTEQPHEHSTEGRA